MSQIIGVPESVNADAFEVRIPTLGDDASIEEALRVYHFGIDNYTNQSLQLNPPVGIAAHLKILTDDITAINAELDTLPSIYIESISSATTENIIYSESIGITPLKIRAIAGQTSPLLSFHDSSGTKISEITTAGAFSGRALLTSNSTAVTQSVNTNTTAIATTAFVLGQANSTAATITMNGTQSAGSSNLYARADHVHPIDTSRSPLAGSSSLVTVGTITTGKWQADIIAGQYGGTGVANTGKTITVSGNTVIGSGTNTVTFTTSGNTSVALPTSGTLAIVGNPLSQFASTTSAQLAGVISDETGTGKLVFGTSPTFTTSILTDSTSFDLLNTTATTINFAGAAGTVNIGSGSTNVNIPGNLTVTGTTTYTSTNNVLVGGMMMVLGDGSGTTDNNKDRGILFDYNNGSAVKGFFGFDDSTGKFTFVPVATVTGDVVSGTKGTIDAYLDWADVLNKPDPVITLSMSGDVNGSGTVTLTDLTSGTLTVSNMTIQANSVALGTDTTGNYVATVTSNSTNSLTVGNSGTETAAVTLTLAQDIHTTANPTFAGVTADSVRIGITAANEIDTSAGNLIIDSTGGTTTIDDNLIVSGDLTVNGTTTTINTSTLTVDDINIEMGAVTTPTDTTANGGGIVLKGATDKTILWDSANANWTSSEHWNIATGKSFKINNTAVLSATTLGSGVTISSLTQVGTITSGIWSASFGAVSGANLTNLTANNLSGTIPGSVLGNSTHYVGTTAVALNRASANQALTGISSISFPGATSGTAIVQAQAVAGTPTLSLPVSTGTLIGTGDTGSVSTTMIANDAVTYAKIQNVSAQYRVLGRISASAGDTEELTGENLVTVLGQATSKQGSGSIVFATSPTLTTPNIGAASGTSLSATGAISGNTLSSTTTTTSAQYILSNSANATITVERGANPDTQIRWSEADGVWQYTNDGTNYQPLGGGAAGTFEASFFLGGM